MELLESLFDALPDLLPFLVAIAAVVLTLWFADWLLFRRLAQWRSESRVARQVTMLVITALGLFVVIMALPLTPETRQQVLNLLGLVVTAVIALSSATFVSNAMAGLMLRAVRSFRHGDFIRVGDQFGRVTERGLFHTEIQTEDRDLSTLPNMYLVTNPVTVVRASGTIVSCTLSLGYDLPHGRIEPLLVEAAKAAELQEPFVQVLDLGNFSVSYRVAGFLPEVKQLLTVRSTLRKRVLDTLHGAGIEIVSPTFMNQRQIPPGTAFIAPSTAAEPPAPAAAKGPEDLIFDKAEQAARAEDLKVERDRLADEIKDTEKGLGAVSGEEREALERRLQDLQRRLDEIDTATEG